MSELPFVFDTFTVTHLERSLSMHSFQEVYSVRVDDHVNDPYVIMFDVLDEEKKDYSSLEDLVYRNIECRVKNLKLRMEEKHD